jgi:hypothetical protein
MNIEDVAGDSLKHLERANSTYIGIVINLLTSQKASTFLWFIYHLLYLAIYCGFSRTFIM